MGGTPSGIPPIPIIPFGFLLRVPYFCSGLWQNHQS